MPLGNEALTPTHCGTKSRRQNAAKGAETADEWLYELETQQSRNPFALANSALHRLWVSSSLAAPESIVPPSLVDAVGSGVAVWHSTHRVVPADNAENGGVGAIGDKAIPSCDEGAMIVVDSTLGSPAHQPLGFVESATPSPLESGAETQNKKRTSAAVAAPTKRGGDERRAEELPTFLSAPAASRVPASAQQQSLPMSSLVAEATAWPKSTVSLQSLPAADTAHQEAGAFSENELSPAVSLRSIVGWLQRLGAVLNVAGVRREPSEVRGELTYL